MPGFTLKLLVSSGGYIYPSGAFNADVDGALVSAAALPGWRITSDNVSVGVYAGPIVQDYRLMEDDPGNHLRGEYLGAQVAADVWYQPSPATMIAVNATGASIGPTESVRAAFGWRLSTSFFIGPESQAIWCADYRQLRLGAHLTGLRINAIEWSAAAGWATESDRRTGGPYLRLGLSTKY